MLEWNTCKRKKLFAGLATLLIFFWAFTPGVPAIENDTIASYQKKLSNEPVGERIAFWAEKFVGVPYDPDPLGEYVREKTIVADDRVDCMYLSFRSLELALGHTPGEAVAVALDERFKGKGELENGKVVNYGDRFQYGEDMIDSGKWGVEITKEIAPVTFIKGSRGRQKVGIVSKEGLLDVLKKKDSGLKSGDFIFFVKSPAKRIVGEIVGHLGIIKREGDDIYLIHASGEKNKGGAVKKVRLYDYTAAMPFVGVRVSRFN